MRLSKAKIKLIRSLEQKKQRDTHRLFVAEGPKLVDELWDYFECSLLVATEQWVNEHRNYKADELIIVNQRELTQASALKTPQQVLALFKQPNYPMEVEAINNSLCLALDGIQDPGNLGTIVRLADWFGIEHIFCSPHTADIYNTKAIQATMGGLARVKMHYTSLIDLIKEVDAPVYGTFLDGETIYDKNLSQKGLIVMGNEGQGISPELETLITHKLYIPNYPLNKDSAESLNVAIATAVVCSEFRRQAIK